MMFDLWPVYSGERFRASWPSCFFLLAGRGRGREGSIMSGLPHQFNDFSADTKQSQIKY